MAEKGKSPAQPNVRTVVDFSTPGGSTTEMLRRRNSPFHLTFVSFANASSHGLSTLKPSKSKNSNPVSSVKSVASIPSASCTDRDVVREDQTQLARLLDEAMISIGEFEQQEPVWQKQFAVNGTLGEKAADAVAGFGGTMWMGLNTLLDKVASVAWDPFPFILLNLFLSSVAALQIILRAEHQVRHVNAKMDHLLSHQWKRLLEIQEIEIDLLQSLQIQHPQPLNALSSGEQGRAATVAHATTSWIIETSPDEHTRVLLSLVHGGRDVSDTCWCLRHWHTDGDNFMGMIDNVRVELKNAGALKRITYDVNFNDPTATLDDIFSGEGTITLRNDFDLKHMVLGGKFSNIIVYSKDRSPVSLVNGDLPPRYKSTFGNNFKRFDKITDFWKLPSLNSRSHFFPNPSALSASMYVKTIQAYMPNVSSTKAVKEELSRPSTPSSSITKQSPDPLGYLKAIVGVRPLPTETWRKVAVAEWAKEKQSGGSTDSHATDMFLLEAQPITCIIDEELKGPACYVFLCDETKVSFHANIED
ncbi:hypothetical protein BC829DRAFT_448626 [Chytridium lagenaria]|nr:hypothetical protein BC829DRAFT_448626 [Chytridium lagenaria]